MTLSGRLVLAVGTLLFLHSAYSTYEHLSLRKSFGLSGGVPIDIVLETVAALVVLVLGVAYTATPLKPVAWSAEMRNRSIDQVDARPGFAALDHRAPFLFKAD